MRWFWNLYAWCYDAISLLIPYRQLMVNLVEALDLKPGMVILDAGCGTGNLEVEIAKRCEGVRVVAADFSHAMLERARSKNGNGVSFMVANLNGILPFADGAFDRVVSSNVLYTLQDPGYSISEFSRVLAKGGVMVTTTPRQKPKLSEIFAEHLRRANLIQKLQTGMLIPRLLVVLVFNLVIVAKGGRGTYHFFTKDQIEQLCSGKGQLAYAGQNWLVRRRK